VNSMKSYLRSLFPYFPQPHDGHGTHIPVLEEACKLLSSTTEEQLLAIEFGTGFYSTKFLSKFLSQKNLFPDGQNSLISIESDKEWLARTKKNYTADSAVCKHDFFWTGGSALEDWENTINNITNAISKSPDLVFLDSSPWESRTLGLKAFGEAKIVLIHDCDYFPANKIWGIEESPIIYKGRKFFHGKLKKQNLGFRDYSECFKYWIEFFPFKPGYFTGPPTLIGSNHINLHNNFLHRIKDKGICLYSEDSSRD